MYIHRFAVAALICVIASPRFVFAVDKTWINPGTGFWSGAGNWSPSGLPLSGDNIYLTNSVGQTVTYDLQGDFLPLYGNVLVRGMTLRLNEPFLAQSLTVGTFAALDSYCTLAFGKSVEIGALDIGQRAIVDLGSGTASMTTVNQSNGYFIGSYRGTRISSSFHLSGGTFLGGLINNGTFLHDGGSIFGQGSNVPDITNNGTFIANRLFDDSTPKVLNSGTGKLFVYPSASARFHSVSNAGSMSFAPNSATIVRDRISQTDTGYTVQQSSIRGTLQMTGFWHQQAGTFTMDTDPALTFSEGNAFDVGYFGNGTYELSGGTIIVNESQDNRRVPIQIGYQGNGTFLQSAGHVDCDSTLIIGSNSGRGYYHLSGGTLRPQSILVGSANSTSGTLVQSGGSISSTISSFIINENAASTALVDLNGGTSAFLSVVNNGTLQVRGNHASQISTLLGSGDLSVTASGLLKVFYLRQNSLTLSGNGKVERIIFGGGGYTHRVRSLSMASAGNTIFGTFDLDTDDLVIDYSGASPIADIRKYLVSGRAAGAWTGTGLKSTTAAANPANNTTLGHAEASQIFGATGGEFGDVLVDASAVLVKYTYYGDTDLNGIVDFDDYSRIDSGFNNQGTGGEINWFRGDFDYNGVIDFDDYSLIDQAFNTQSGTLRPPTSAVPEPSIIMLGLVVAGGVRRRRRTCGGRFATRPNHR